MLLFMIIALVHTANILLICAEGPTTRAGTNSLFVYRWYVTGSPAVKRELFMTIK